MSLLKEIKNEAKKNGTKIQTSEEREIETKLNKLFYLEKDIKKNYSF